MRWCICTRICVTVDAEWVRCGLKASGLMYTTSGPHPGRPDTRPLAYGATPTDPLCTGSTAVPSSD